MADIPLNGGTYSARSLAAAAQRCVNLYPELNPNDVDPARPMTHYTTPGSVTLASPPIAGPGRGLYRAGNGSLFGVVGSKLYKISSSFVFTELTTLGTGSSQVSMADNGVEMMLVDGSATGYTVNLSTDVVGAPTDTGFQGGVKVDYLDTFLLTNRPGTGQFNSSLGNTTQFDPLYFAVKSGDKENIRSLIIVDREMWLFGEQKATELWFNSDSPDFPFQIINGAYIEHGCAAAHSVANYGSLVFWLVEDEAGNRFVARGRDYRMERISTHAIEKEIKKYSVVSDAVGMIYSVNGHPFFVLTFPTADKTWVFDTSTSQWHEWAWIDTNGKEHRHRAGAMASAYGENLYLDWQDGTLRKLDPEVYNDFGGPITRRRGFPHFVSEGKLTKYNYFLLDMDCGHQPGGTSFDPPEVSLRWSDTRGNSWGDAMKRDAGATGEYSRQIRYNRLGAAKDRVFEIHWSNDFFTALQGAWLDGEEAQTP